MKKAFTLVEMLIVVVVLVTLMTVAFRLSSIGSNETRRNDTIARMQRLENCLSGYYAAFGTYPPVRLHGTRNIYATVGDYGLQDIDGDENQNLWGWNDIGETSESRAWNQVRAACKVQPVACRFPFPEGYDKVISSVMEQLKKRANSGEKQYESYWKDESVKKKLTRGFENLTSGNAVGNLVDSEDWRETHVFQFGLMSYLLPRYLFMFNFDKDARDTLLLLKQWTGNNTLPHDPYTGDAVQWMDLYEWFNGSDSTGYPKLANVPSQAVCARWMPNLEGICAANMETTFYGITITNPYRMMSELSINNPWIEVYTTGENGSGTPYVLDRITVLDGWDHEFYYYSPAPFQTYTLWSAGANNRTFPPWINRGELDSKANRCISKWIADDIIHLSN